MKVTFVAIGCEQLPVSQLSAIARKNGHDVGLAFSAALFDDKYVFYAPRIASFFDDRHVVIEKIKQQKPDVLCFSVLSNTYQWMLGIAREAREIFPNIKTVFGGVHPSAVPELVLSQPEVDYVVVGEGDVAFPFILQAIENGDQTTPIVNTRFLDTGNQVIKGTQTGFIQDLDSLPFFDKVLWEEDIRHKDLYMTMASRGCPYRCTFCFNNFFATLPDGKKGKYVRQRSVEHMMQELRIAKKRYDMRFVDFLDDVFTVNKKWLKEFLYLYKKEINVPFQCLTHAAYVDDEVAKWMSDAGCYLIRLGVQTVDEDFKYNVIKRYEKNDHIERVFKAVKSNKIKVKVDHMFGMLDEPIEAQEKARQFYVKHTPTRIQVFWTQYYPGTKMLDQAVEKGILTQEEKERIDAGENYMTFRKNSPFLTPEVVKMYTAYQTIFTLFSITPKSLRHKLSPQVFKRLPMFVCTFLIFLVDLGHGLCTKNPDHKTYARHLLHHLYGFFIQKFGFKKPPATRPYSNVTFDSPPVDKIPEISTFAISAKN